MAIGYIVLGTLVGIAMGTTMIGAGYSVWFALVVYSFSGAVSILVMTALHFLADLCIQLKKKPGLGLEDFAGRRMF